MSQERTPSFFAIIPATVRYCKELEPSAKLLYGELTALMSKEGYCWASNKYLSDLYGVHERTIERWITSLEDQNFIKRDVDNSGSSHPRKIWISDAFIEKREGVTKMSGGDDKNVGHINTYINTKEKKEISKDISKEDASTEVSAFCLLLIKKIKEKKLDFSKEISTPWHKNAAKLLKLRKVEELIKIIDFGLNDSFWFSKILSPEKLLKHLDALEIEMKKPSWKLNENSILENQSLLRKTEIRYKHIENITFGNDYIEFNKGAAPAVYLKTSDSSFREQLINNLRKMGLDVEGL